MPYFLRIERQCHATASNGGRRSLSGAELCKGTAEQLSGGGAALFQAVKFPKKGGKSGKNCLILLSFSTFSLKKGAIMPWQAVMACRFECTSACWRW
jgi:hypothetical protein